MLPLLGGNPELDDLDDGPYNAYYYDDEEDEEYDEVCFDREHDSDSDDELLDEALNEFSTYDEAEFIEEDLEYCDEQGSP